MIKVNYLISLTSRGLGFLFLRGLKELFDTRALCYLFFFFFFVGMSFLGSCSSSFHRHYADHITIYLIGQQTKKKKLILKPK